MKIAIVNTNKISPFKHDVHFGIAYIIQYAKLHLEKVDYLDLSIVNWNKFGKIIEDYDLVGYSILSHDYYHAIKAISINRKANSDVTIVVGGIDPSTDSDKYMKNLDIDHVVTGEGEISFFKIIQAKKENKK
ncbi:MAG: cobalamin-dependent protein, partial [Methanobrevibacter sp.]|nr:cobalamin-dependent protein [Candidatus Methanovirga aequatorialis]